MTGPEYDEPLPPDPEGGAASRLAVLQSRLLSNGDLDSIPPMTPVIDGILFRDTINWLHGARSSFKSIIALHMGAAVGSGLEWAGHATKQGTVLYLVLEGLAGIRQRVRAWEDWQGIPMAGVTFLPGPISLVGDSGALGLLAHSGAYDLVIVDTQAMATMGLDEQSARDMGLIIEGAERIRSASGSCVLLVTHEAIGGFRPRGHGSQDGAAGSMLRAQRDGPVVWLTNTKQKDAPEAPTIMFEVNYRCGSVVLEVLNGTPRELTDSEQTVLKNLRILARLKGGATHTDLKDACGLPPSTFNLALQRLARNRGLARNTSKTRTSWWQPVDPAEAARQMAFGDDTSEGESGAKSNG